MLGPALTIIPISDLKFELSNFKSDLVDLFMGPFDQLLPGFENWDNFVFKYVADGYPIVLLLSVDQLCQRPLQGGRNFLAGNLCIRRFSPSEIFRKDCEIDPNRVE